MPCKHYIAEHTTEILRIGKRFHLQKQRLQDSKLSVLEQDNSSRADI